MAELPQLHCLRCNHNWQSRIEDPAQCPKCHSYNWDTKPETVRIRNCPTVSYSNIASRQKVAI